MEWSLTARWVFPVDAPPLPNGVITISGDRIKAVEAKGTRAADRDLGNVAIIPGLVNAHIHLDLSGLRGRFPPSQDFTGWLRALIDHRRQTDWRATRAAIWPAIGELVTGGTTLVGDIAAIGLSFESLSHAALRAVVFTEVLGLIEARGRPLWEQATEWLAAPGSPNLRRALSPHAPYSVGRWLFQAAAERSSAVPIAIHAGETRAELELLEHHSGPFVPFLQQLGAWAPENLMSSVNEVLGLFKAPNLLIIHANYLKPEQIPRGATVVYCPRTHASFGHPAHPFRDFLKAGIRVALGTDSLASNPDLDVFAEAQFVRKRHPDLASADLLRMITLSGAEGLGWADEAGSLKPGKSADVVGIPLPNADDGDPHALLFDSVGGKRLVVFRGGPI